MSFIIIMIYYICSLVQSKFKSCFSCKSNSTSNQKLLSFYYIDLAPWIIDSILLSLLFSIYLLEVCSSICLFIFLEETGYSFCFLDCNSSLSLFVLFILKQMNSYEFEIFSGFLISLLTPVPRITF